MDTKEGLAYALGVLFVITIVLTISQILLLQVLGLQFLAINASFHYLIIGLCILEILMAGYLNSKFIVICLGLVLVVQSFILLGGYLLLYT